MKAKSSLPTEVLQLFQQKMINLRLDLIVPECFLDFRGAEMKNTVQNETTTYTLGLGNQFLFDQRTE